MIFGKLSVARRRILLLIVLPATGLAIGAYFYVQSLSYATTDDAFIKQDKVYVATEVSGRLHALPIHEYEQVKAGTLLLQLDKTQFTLSLLAARANLDQVKNDLESLIAEYHLKNTELVRANSDLAYAQRNYARIRKVAKPGFASGSTLDQAHQRFEDAKLSEASSRQAIDMVRAKLGDDPNKPIDQFSSYQQAVAERDLAALRLKKTAVYAPMDGTIGPLAVQPGDFIPAGRSLFPLVATSYYVQANFKETELAPIRSGQHAEITVDAYPHRVWKATVERISPATGSEFSLLPPENASGNWVKVVQRVAIRLRLEKMADSPPLRSGLSIHVSIDIRGPTTKPQVDE